MSRRVIRVELKLRSSFLISSSKDSVQMELFGERSEKLSADDDSR